MQTFQDMPKVAMNHWFCLSGHCELTTAVVYFWKLSEDPRKFIAEVSDSCIVIATISESRDSASSIHWIRWFEHLRQNLRTFSVIFSVPSQPHWLSSKSCPEVAYQASANMFINNINSIGLGDALILVSRFLRVIYGTASDLSLRLDAFLAS